MVLIEVYSGLPLTLFYHYLKVKNELPTEWPWVTSLTLPHSRSDLANVRNELFTCWPRGFYQSRRIRYQVHSQPGRLRRVSRSGVERRQRLRDAAPPRFPSWPVKDRSGSGSSPDAAPALEKPHPAKRGAAGGQEHPEDAVRLLRKEEADEGESTPLRGGALLQPRPSRLPLCPPGNVSHQTKAHTYPQILTRPRLCCSSPVTGPRGGFDGSRSGCVTGNKRTDTQPTGNDEADAGTSSSVLQKHLSKTIFLADPVWSGERR